MNWSAMMRAAGRLGVSPEAFWRLSLKEWRWLTGAGEAAAMTRTEMERLAERWPDKEGAGARTEGEVVAPQGGAPLPLHPFGVPLPTDARQGGG